MEGSNKWDFIFVSQSLALDWHSSFHPLSPHFNVGNGFGANRIKQNQFLNLSINIEMGGAGAAGVQLLLRLIFNKQDHKSTTE